VHPIHAIVERTNKVLDEQAESLGRLDKGDAIKTYRYLRIGMIGAVGLLGVAIAIEWRTVPSHCFQTSISAYYYTPVRAIFVGAMMAVGLALIVYKGRKWPEDLCLNIAGLLAPIIAVAPTTDVGPCWSVRPIPLPVRPNDTLAAWVKDNINNNFYALLYAAVIGLTFSIILVIAIEYRASNRGDKKATEKGTWLSIIITAVAILIGWLLIEHWGGFYTQAHGYSALLFFVFLGGAILINAGAHRRKARKSKAAGNEPARKREWRLWVVYGGVVVLMILGFIIFGVFDVGGDHSILWLEAWEIALFATYWLVQTAENWDEDLPMGRAEGKPVGARSTDS